MSWTRRSAGRIATALVGAVTAGSIALGAGPALAAKAPKAPKVTVTAGDVVVRAVAGKPDALPDDVRTAALATVAAYLRATGTPTRSTTTADAALAPLLTTAAAGRLGGTDRATLLDEGLPAPTGKVRIVSAPVGLTALADADGAVVLVTAGLDATTTVPTASGKVTVHRTGSLVLVPDGGTWKIQGYDLSVERVGKKLGATTGTTAPAAPATTTPGTVTR